MSFFRQTQAKTIDLDSHPFQPKSLVVCCFGEKLREEEEEEEEEMMLKIDEITHFLRIVKSQNAIRICVSEAQTSVQPYEIFFKDKISNLNVR